MEWRSKIGPLTAAGITISLVAWMALSGNGITISPAEAQPANAEQQVTTTQTEALNVYSVQAQTLNAQVIEVHLPLSGKTVANESLLITNSYAGRIVKLPVKKGDLVTANSTILQVDTRTLRSQFDQARLLVKQRLLELDGTKKLNAGNLASKVNLAQAETQLATAKATEKALLVDLENATVKAPFRGILNTLEVKEGQVIADKTVIGNLISLNPIRIRVNIPQNKVYEIKQGTPGIVTLESGKEIAGIVSYMSATANEASRTISVELLADNPDNSISAGLTAKVDFVLEKQKAHAFSPALLTLDDNGKTAVKIIDLNNKVKLMPVDIIKSDRDQVWVNGLPEQVNIITVGQGFVKPGDRVNVHYKN